jgi:hypothetical protein
LNARAFAYYWRRARAIVTLSLYVEIVYKTVAVDLGKGRSLDLGKGRSLVPSDYCARHGMSVGACRLQSWDFEGSNDGSNYTVLRSHRNDNSLPEQGFSMAAWKVEGVNQAYRYFRIRQTGVLNSFNNDGTNHCLFCAGIELYGMLLLEQMKNRDIS